MASPLIVELIQALKHSSLEALSYKLVDASGATVATLSPGTGGTVVSDKPVRLPSYTVAALPAGVAGDRAFVTNALAPVFGSAVAGGGAVTVPVYYTGAAWFVG